MSGPRVLKKAQPAEVAVSLSCWVDQHCVFGWKALGWLISSGFNVQDFMARTSSKRASRHTAQPVQASAAAMDVKDQVQRSLSLEHSSSSAMTQDELSSDEGLLLQLIRILALYLYVFLSQNAVVAMDDVMAPGKVHAAALALEHQLHAIMLACVKDEMVSNQFDGLIRERRVFLAMKKLFKQQQMQLQEQIQVLLHLLTTYLALLQAPIVRCEPVSTLTSTLEYLLKERKPVSLPLLYPLVNAIDSLTTEQRECLDALTMLWKWLAACDPTEMLLEKIIRQHRHIIIGFERSPTGASAREPLRSCFVHTLVAHSDHIFRRDMGFADPHAAFASDTEDDDDFSEGVPSPSKSEIVIDELSPLSDTSSSSSSTEPQIENDVKPVESPPRKTDAPAKDSPRTTNRKNHHKKKRLEKVVVVTATTGAPSKAADDKALVVDEENVLPTVVCVGIAAAAGTIAAALCVIFT